MMKKAADKEEQSIPCSELADYFDDVVGQCSVLGSFNGQKFNTETQFSVLVAGTKPGHCF